MAVDSLDPGAASAPVWAGKMEAYGSNHTVIDQVLPEMLHLIDPHWYQFPPMNPLWHGLLGFVIAVLGFVSISGNGMVIYIFTTTKTLKTPSNLLVLNLAVSDFLMMTCMAPPLVVNSYHETWVFDYAPHLYQISSRSVQLFRQQTLTNIHLNFAFTILVRILALFNKFIYLRPLACGLYAGSGSLFGTISIWTMTMIAFDRYNVIVKGIAAKPMTNNGALLRILAIWVASLAWTVAPMFGWNRYVPEGNMTACGTDYLNKDWFSRSYIVAYAIFCYFTPLALIIYSYFFIIQAVAAHERAMREQAKKMNVASLRSSEAANTSAECKLAKVALMTISLWFMAWTPYLVINFTGIFETATISPLGTIWGSVFAKANAVYNPIVYGISHPKYRAALYQRFPSLACQPAADDNTSQVSGKTAVCEEKPSA